MGVSLGELPSSHFFRSARRKAAIERSRLKLMRNEDMIAQLERKVADLQVKLNCWEFWWHRWAWAYGTTNEVERNGINHRNEDYTSMARESEACENMNGCTGNVNEMEQLEVEPEDERAANAGDTDVNVVAYSDLSEHSLEHAPCESRDMEFGMDESVAIEKTSFAECRAQGESNTCEMSEDMEEHIDVEEPSLDVDSDGWPLQPSCRWSALCSSLRWSDRAENVGDYELEELYFAVMQKASQVAGAIGDDRLKLLAQLGRKCMNKMIDRLGAQFSLLLAHDRLGLRDLLSETVVDAWRVALHRGVAEALSLELGL